MRTTVVASAVVVGIALPVVHQTVPHEGIHDTISGAVAAARGSDEHDHGGSGSSGLGVDGTSARRNVTSARRNVTSAGRKSNCPKPSAPTIRDGFEQPKYLKSKNGKLFVALRPALVPVEINGQIYQSSVYNHQYPGPTLVICQGDLLRINVRNALDPANYEAPAHDPGIAAETNIHTHGFHVSPRQPSDNIFVVIKPGEVFKYRYRIPRNHPPGFYWYHPHRHGQTNVQDFGGMNGAIIIKGGLDGARVWRNIGTRDLVINQTALGQGATIQPGPMGPFTPPGTQWFVNGNLNPQINIQPGELQRWRITNNSAGSFLFMGLEGPLPPQPSGAPSQSQPFQVLALDGNYLPRITTEDTMLIAPASRREILVMGPPVRGSYALKQLPFAPQGGAPNPEQTLATLNTSGSRIDAKLPPRDLPDQQRDLRNDKIDTFHKIVYSQDPPDFFINGEQFTNSQNVMEKLELNKTSQWTIQNTTTFWHTFHIHINDFQIIKENGVPVRQKKFADNISIPPGESVTMRYRPTDFTGKFVFHCHVLGHEDNGMMAVVQVVKKL
jgi:suppressor of ftsI